MLPIAPFRPRLIDALKGYDSAHFARDFAAGLAHFHLRKLMGEGA